MVINATDSSLTVQNFARINKNSLNTAIERLSSGLRINRAADDPSGLAISTGMKAQIRGIATAQQNIQDGISMLQLMDGALSETHTMVMRMRDICVRGANEATLTDEDRAKMQIELDSLALEITRKAETTTFNEKKVLVGDVVPGGYKIVFSSYRNGPGEIFTMNFDGTNQLSLGVQINTFQPRISPDGDKILYPGADGRIHIMDNDGTNDVVLQTGITPAWSPDGEKIAFSGNSALGLDIYIMNKDGSNVTQVTYLGNVTAEPFWAPDGSKLYFLSNTTGNSEVYEIDIDGQNLNNLSNNPATESEVFCSSDGKYITFDSTRLGAWSIFIMNKDGTNQQSLKPPQWDTFASWVPHQNIITFSGAATGNQNIYSMNSDGTNIIQLTNNPATDDHPFTGSPGPDDQVLQVGPDGVESHRLTVTFRDMRAQAIGVAGISVNRQKAAYCGIELCDHGIGAVSDFRAEIGQDMRRLEKVANDLSAEYINISAANSRIEDADMAIEMSNLSTALIKEQSITASASYDIGMKSAVAELTKKNIENI